MSILGCSTCKTLQQENQFLRAHIQDQRDAYLKLQEVSRTEHSMLLDRILAVTAPTAVRELNRPSYSPIPRERRPVELRDNPVMTPFSTAPAPRPEGRRPQPGRLRPKPPLEDDRASHTTPEEAAAEIAGEAG